MGTYDTSSGYPRDDSDILMSQMDALEQECLEHMKKRGTVDTGKDCDDMECSTDCPLMKRDVKVHKF